MNSATSLAGAAEQRAERRACTFPHQKKVLLREKRQRFRHPEFRALPETALPERPLHLIAVRAEGIAVALGKDDRGGVELVADRHTPGAVVLDDCGLAF